MKEIIFDLLSVGKPAKAFSLNPEVKRSGHRHSVAQRSTVDLPGTFYRSKHSNFDFYQRNVKNSMWSAGSFNVISLKRRIFTLPNNS